jgi:DNA-binding transcriptional LysR family regulator
VLREGSFAGAARALHRVPSAVSYAVAGLEEALGVVLFDRAGHKVALTPAGQRVAGQAAALLDAARRLDALGRALGGGHEPGLQIVVDGALPIAPVLAAVGRFSALGLPTRVRVDVEFQDGVVERFLEDRADLVLALDLENAGAVRQEPLPPLEMVLVAAAGHPLLGRARADRADLQAFPELVVRGSSRAARARPLEPWYGGAHALYLPDFPAKAAALRQGLGFGWLPLPLAADDLAAGRLAPVPAADGGRWTYRPALAWRAAEPLGPAGLQLKALILDEAATAAAGPAPVHQDS